MQLITKKLLSSRFMGQKDSQIWLIHAFSCDIMGMFKFQTLKEIQ